jgi:hypothetical protein
MVTSLIPEGFLPIRKAAEKLASALYSGEPDRAIVAQYREREFDVADGDAIDHAISKIWSAVDRDKLHALVFSAARPEAVTLPSNLSRGIPLLRSPRGGNFTFLRPSNENFAEFSRRFGCDLSAVSVIFRETEINRLARALLRARRRKVSTAGTKKRGRPSRQCDVKPIIHEIIAQHKWSPTQSLKALTKEVNRRGKWLDDVSDETVDRALSEIHGETGDRRFERVRQVAGTP